MQNKMLKHLFQVENFRLVVNDAKQDNTETLLQRRHLVQLIDNNFRHFILAQLKNYAQTVTV